MNLLRHYSLQYTCVFHLRIRIVFSHVPVLDLLQREIEDRINNQIWTLAQELFRSHMDPHKYQDVEKIYRDQQHKYAINGYLQVGRLLFRLWLFRVDLVSHRYHNSARSTTYTPSIVT